MQELQAKASRERFGDLVQVSESQYKNEINNAGTGVWVVVCLFQQGIPACGLLLQRLQVLARKFKATKFVKITATDAIRNYPDRNCPTLLIYYEGDLKRQLVGLSALGGLNTTEAGAASHARARATTARARPDGWPGGGPGGRGVPTCAQTLSGTSRRSVPSRVTWRRRPDRASRFRTPSPWPTSS